MDEMFIIVLGTCMALLSLAFSIAEFVRMRLWQSEMRRMNSVSAPPKWCEALFRDSSEARDG